MFRISVALRAYSFIRLAQIKRVKALKEKYPNLANKIQQLADKDPSGKMKYLAWQVKQLLHKEPLKEIIDLTNQFHKGQQRLDQQDINTYQNLGELRSKFEQLGGSRGEEKAQAYAESDTLYRSDRFLVIVPNSTGASCYFGKGTRWCISATQSQNYFEEYAMNNVFVYLIIDRKTPTSDPMHKIAYAIKHKTEIEIFDAKDERIAEDEVKKHLGDEFNNIRAQITDHNERYETTPVRQQLEEEATKLEEKLPTMTPEDVWRYLHRDWSLFTEIQRYMLLTTIGKGAPLNVEVIDYLIAQADKWDAETAITDLLKFNPNINNFFPKTVKALLETYMGSTKRFLKELISPEISNSDNKLSTVLWLISQKGLDENSGLVYESLENNPNAGPETLNWVARNVDLRGHMKIDYYANEKKLGPETILGQVVLEHPQLSDIDRLYLQSTYR